MHFPASAAFRRHRLGFDHHLGDFFKTAAGRVAQSEDGVEMDESGEEFGQIIRQGRIGQPQRRLKSLLGKPGEQAAQGVVRVAATT